MRELGIPQHIPWISMTDTPESCKNNIRQRTHACIPFSRPTIPTYSNHSRSPFVQKGWKILDRFSSSNYLPALFSLESHFFSPPPESTLTASPGLESQGLRAPDGVPPSVPLGRAGPLQGRSGLRLRAVQAQQKAWKEVEVPDL